jgi:hypothetical protein
VTLLLLGVSGYGVPELRKWLESHFATEAQLGILRSLFLTLGGALIGAAAIVSSLVLFAMQVNIERMPHGLFRRLSADPRLLSAFAAILAVVRNGGVWRDGARVAVLVGAQMYDLNGNLLGKLAAGSLPISFKNLVEGKSAHAERALVA